MNSQDKNSPWVYVALITVVIVGIGAIAYLQFNRSQSQSTSLADADDLVSPNESAVPDHAQLKVASSTSLAPVPAAAASMVVTQPSIKAEPMTASATSTPQPKTSGKLKRPPYPMPGETYPKPIKPTLLADQTGFAAGGERQAKPGQIIPWNHARQSMGQTITIEGKIVRAHKTKTVCFLNFTENWRGRFYVILFKKVLGGWPQSPEKYFMDKTVQVTGEVKNRGGTPQIQVTDPGQIKMVSDK